VETPARMVIRKVEVTRDSAKPNIFGNAILQRFSICRDLGAVLDHEGPDAPPRHVTGLDLDDG